MGEVERDVRRHLRQPLLEDHLVDDQLWNDRQHHTGRQQAVPAEPAGAPGAVEHLIDGFGGNQRQKERLLHVIEDPVVYLPMFESYALLPREQFETYAQDRLENWVTGSDAERLYTRLGWLRCGEIPGYALWPRGGLCSTTVLYRELVD